MVAVTWLAPGLLLTERYRLVNRIAAGGMGEVWCATDTRLDRDVAVKVLRSELSDDPEFRRRFLLEAHITAALNAPSIAAVYDYGETVLGADGAGRTVTYLVMELVDGEPLSAVLAPQHRMPADRVLDVLEQAGDALDVAHQRGLVHRDVKPANILITAEGRVKLTDFGIARALSAATVTSTGMVIGTAQYMSPEQAAGQKAGTASDVYSLGVVGYEALAGRRPFEGESAVALAVQHLRDTPPPLPDDVPAGARALIEVALVKDPHLRYSTGGEFADAAAAVRGGRALPPPPGVAHGTAQVRPAAAIVASGPTAVVAPAARRSDASDLNGGRPHGATPVDALADVHKPPAPVPAPSVSPTKPSTSSTATESPPDSGRRRPARRAVLVGLLGLITVLLAVVGVLAARGAGNVPTGADVPADPPPTVAPGPPSGDASPGAGGPAEAGAPGRPADLPGGAADESSGGPGGAPGSGAGAAPTDPQPGSEGAGSSGTGSGGTGSGGARSGGTGSGGTGSGAGPTDPRSGSGSAGSGAAGSGAAESGAAGSGAPGSGAAGSGAAESGRTGSGTGDSGGGSARTGGAAGGTGSPGAATGGGVTGGGTGGGATPAPTGDTDDDKDDDTGS